MVGVDVVVVVDVVVGIVVIASSGGGVVVDGGVGGGGVVMYWGCGCSCGGRVEYVAVGMCVSDGDVGGVVVGAAGGDVVVNYGVVYEYDGLLFSSYFIIFHNI